MIGETSQMRPEKQPFLQSSIESSLLFSVATEICCWRSCCLCLSLLMDVGYRAKAASNYVPSGGYFP